MLNVALGFGQALKHELKMDHRLGMWLTHEMKHLGIPVLESSIDALDELISRELEENPELSLIEEASTEIEEHNGEAGQPVSEDDADCWDEHAFAAGGARIRNGSSDVPASREALLVETLSLGRHLQQEMRMAGLSAREQNIGDALIVELDESGFLSVTVEEIAALQGVTAAKVASVLGTLQELAPAGVGARDLREAYLLQLQRMGREESLAAEIVRNCWDELKSGQISRICRFLQCSRPQVDQALKCLAGLAMRPGEGFACEAVAQLPDAFVTQGEDGSWNIRIARGRTDSLVVNAENTAFTADAAAAAFCRDLRRNASRFIEMIAYRHQALFQVVEQIVRRQVDFFERGEEWLVPLTQAEVAAEVGLSEATLSRLVGSKCIETPHGVFPLQFFFDSGVNTFNGGSLAARSVKARIARMVAEEDRKHPLSDQDMTNRLVAEGIDISCRAVNKYRESEQLGSSRERRWR